MQFYVPRTLITTVSRTSLLCFVKFSPSVWWCGKSYRLMHTFLNEIIRRGFWVL